MKIDVRLLCDLEQTRVIGYSKKRLLSQEEAKFVPYTL